MNQENIYYATGKRKTSIAKTWIKPGKGEITVNKRPVDEYFPIESLKGDLLQPLQLTNTVDSFDIRVSVIGGGISGQSGAIRHGITKALLLANPDFRPILKKAGFITRDSRAKERKKYGQKGARARFQFSKR
ncbi:MAG: 30S ribosomal protein S9 [Desulfobacterales bacterium]|nr:30S ribosomal protein S9 [Desulfobacterales bacterium]MDD4071616.1 30S ribosomal protein S9 [Desulfobacterales bacterium]MDD4391616.1 30S ribosomal protein S9 [Desulfobacterales bacterium]